MTDDKPDTTTLSGAEFLRHAGTDAQKWAEAFWQAYSREERERPETERQQKSTTDWVHSFTVRWLRDYAEVCVAEEVGRVTARLVPRHDD